MLGKNLKYSRLKEDERVISYDKMTVKWVIANTNKVMTTIASHGREHVQECDVWDIYQDVVEYFAKSPDYDINKAISRGHGDTITSIEGYVSSCVKYCVDRHVVNKKRDYAMKERDVEGIDEDYKAVNRIAVYDSSSEVESLEDVCERNTHMRYVYGLDIYQLLYIKLLSKENNLSKREENIILAALDIEKDTLEALDMYNEDSVLIEMVSAINALEIGEAINIIEKYVYGHNNIKRAICK